ncbi:MAG: dTDP-4-dehydrorhamnose reductase [Planctomycetota bacterium]|jgi:dTDP-4-dehydrorhamnose reductase|nr:dTDP-4-dehydrorhamnose reductase [Planctomycetota bacterium]
MWLITGANGQLGRCLRAALGAAPAIYADRDELDVTDEAAVAEFFAQNKIDGVINCAAYTNVDGAEDEPELAAALNAVAARRLAKYGRRIIHLSTDYVFAGKAHFPYDENGSPAPLSVYGKTKLDGERAVLANAETAVVIRTAWLYSEYGKNFVQTMRRLGAERGDVNVIFDQIGTPTYAGDLAAAIVKILPQIKNGAREIYHFTNEGVCSWFDFATKIMELSRLPAKVRPIETKDYPRRAARPPYSVLNKAKIKRDFGLEISHWEASLRRCLEKIIKN